MDYQIKKTKNSIFETIIIFIGIILRFITGILANPSANQHDVLGSFGGHFDYAMYFFKSFKLPDTNVYELCQGPLNAIIQGLFMRITSFTSKDDLEVYANCKILSILWSIIALILIVKILDEFVLKKRVRNVVIAIMSLYPGLIWQAGQYSNDPLSYMLFILSLYLGIKWCNSLKTQDTKKQMLNIILLAISIGLGMLTKISVAIIALIIGPMMVIIWIKSFKNQTYKFKNITLQLVIFAIIVFPLGLSFYIRNAILFDQPLGYVYEIARGTALKINKRKFGPDKRFFSFPIDRLFNEKFFVYHDFMEYNIWIDLIKTSVLDEICWGKLVFEPDRVDIFNAILVILNLIFWIVGIFSVFKIWIWGIIKDRLQKKSSQPTSEDLEYRKSFINLRNISTLLVALALFAYVFFQVNYQYSCNSNYRYIPYITLGLALAIAL